MEAILNDTYVPPPAEEPRKPPPPLTSPRSVNTSSGSFFSNFFGGGTKGGGRAATTRREQIEALIEGRDIPAGPKESKEEDPFAALDSAGAGGFMGSSGGPRSPAIDSRSMDPGMGAGSPVQRSGGESHRHGPGGRDY